MSQLVNIHKSYLLLAHSLAEKKFGQTFPNPAVGCVLVKNNKIIAKASTGITGRPHAEEIVIKKHSNIRCSDAGSAWIDVNAVYRDQVSGDRGLQGHYTKDNKLIWGYYCK